jgi:hypothetical protein
MISRRAALASPFLALAAKRRAKAVDQQIVFMPIDGQSNAYNPPSGELSPFAGRPAAPLRAFGFAGRFAQRRPERVEAGTLAKLAPLADGPRSNASLAVLLAHAIETLTLDHGGIGPRRLYNTTGRGAAPLMAARQALLLGGSSTKLGPYIFVHGESGPNDERYEPMLSDFIQDKQALLSHIFESPAPFMLLQINEADDAGDHTPAALAQYSVARRMDNVWLAGPMYQAPLFDRSHTTLPGRMMIAEMLADSILMLEETGRWTPLWPIAVKRDRLTLRVSFAVPHGGKLAFDRDWVKPSTMEGFSVFDGSSEPPSVTAVTIASRSELDVQIDREPAEKKALLKYAWLGDLEDDGWSGGRGTLMTETGVASVYARLGFPVPPRIRHYCVRFAEPF